MQNISLKKSQLVNNKTHYSKSLYKTFQSQRTKQQKEEKFFIHKELYKGIKQNDVGKIVGRHNENENQINFVYNQYTQAHHILTEMRKKHDEIKGLTNQRKKQIQVMKKELDYVKSKEQFMKQNIKNSKDELQKVKNILKQINEATQNCIFTRDIYLSIQERTKHDNLVIKKNIFEAEIDLNRTRGKFKNIFNDATNKRLIDIQCQTLLTKIEKTVQGQKASRHNRISSIYQMVNKKQQNLMKRINRQKQIEELVINTMNQKSIQQKQWQKLFMTHNFLSCILRKKIQRQLQKHSQIQLAFQNIKMNTGILQCDQFVEKFLTREQIYGQLLQTISEKQPKLQKLQGINQQLQSKHKQLKQIQQDQDFKQKGKDMHLQKYHKDLEIITKKESEYQRQKQVFYQWSIKFLKKYDALLDTNRGKKSYINYYEDYPRKDMVNLFKKVFSIINKVIQEITNKDQLVETTLLKNNIKQTNNNQRLKQRNVRVKTLPTDYKDEQQELNDDMIQNQYVQQYRFTLKKEMKSKKFRIKTKAI